MILDKFQRLSSWVLRITTLVMVVFSLLFMLAGTDTFRGVWEETLFMTTIIFMGVIVVVVFVCIFFFIRQAIIKKIEPWDTIVTCLLFLANIPILLIFSFIIIVIMFTTMELPLQH